MWSQELRGAATACEAARGVRFAGSSNMRRALLALWLISSAVGLFLLGGALHAPVAQFGSPSSLMVTAIWLVGVVPLSMSFWFRLQRRRERDVIEAALETWREGTVGAGALLASAIEFALEEEDEDSLRRLLDALARSAPPTLEAPLQPFLKAAREWLSDDGGHASRVEHLERLKASARPLLPKLQNG
jgi:hypothetical protein